MSAADGFSQAPELLRKMHMYLLSLIVFIPFSVVIISVTFTADITKTIQS